MFPNRSNSWIGPVLALSLALSMLGAGGILHLAEHLPGEEDSEAPLECFQCKIAENSTGALVILADRAQVHDPSEPSLCREKISYSQSVR